MLIQILQVLHPKSKMPIYVQGTQYTIRDPPP